MKWLTPLWSDPVGWSEWFAKTKLRVFIWTLIHLAVAVAGLLMIYKSIHLFYGLTDSKAIALLSISVGAFPILGLGVVYPAMYLYAMHRLLRMLKEKESQNKPD